MRCPLYAEMMAYQSAKQRQDAEKARALASVAEIPLTKPNLSKQQKELGAKAKSSAASSVSRASTAWEFLNEDNTFIEQLVCPRCRRQGMQVKSNGLDGSKFYGCRNFNTIMRCRGTYDWPVGQQLLREGGHGGHSFRG